MVVRVHGVCAFLDSIMHGMYIFLFVLDKVMAWTKKK